MSSQTLYSTAEAAAQAGVSKNTLLRWIAEGRLRDVSRDWRNWRVWTEADLERVKAVRRQLHERVATGPRVSTKAAEMPLYAVDMSRLAEGREYRAR